MHNCNLLFVTTSLFLLSSFVVHVAKAQSPAPVVWDSRRTDHRRAAQLSGLVVSLEKDAGGDASGDGLDIKLLDSACALQMTGTPWAAGCKIKMQVDHGVDEVNNGVPLELSFDTVVSLPEPVSAGIIASADVSFDIPEVSVETSFKTITLPGLTAENVNIELSKERLETGACLADNANESVKDALSKFCADLCIKVQVNFTKEDGSVADTAADRKGANMDLVAVITVFDEDLASSYGEKTACNAALASMKLDGPLQREYSLGSLVYDSVTTARKARSRRKSSTKRTRVGGDLVDSNGWFKFGQQAFQPDAVTLPDPEATLELTDGFTLPSISGYTVSLVDSTCGIVASRQPWSVDCKATVRIDHGKTALNGGQPIDLQAFATAVLDTRKDSKEFAAFRYGFRLPSMTIGELGTDEVVYPGGDGYRIVLHEDDLQSGICISNLPDFFPTVSLASVRADYVGLLASAAGADVCVKTEVSRSSSSSAQMRFVLEAHMLNEDYAVPGDEFDEVMNAARQVIGLSDPLEFNIDMGSLLVKAAGGRRLLAGDGGDINKYLSLDGKFKLGDEGGAGAAGAGSAGTAVKVAASLLATLMVVLAFWCM